MKRRKDPPHPGSEDDFLEGKSEMTRSLYDHFIGEFRKVGAVSVLPAKTMIGIATPRKRIAYVTQLGRDFVHVVFPFPQAYPENECFEKIAKVPGQEQFNHHYRMRRKEDITKEVVKFMQLAWESGS